MVDIPDPSPGLDLSITESTDAELQSSIETQQHIPVIEIVGFKKEQPVGLVVDLAVDVSCKEGCDLRGGVILIGDTNNQVITEQLLVEFDEFEGLSSTDSFSVQIPSEPG
ncbi:MAG: hypothetical protein LBU61_03495, partial [Coriobacteriales bacterium]|nr:hypothetical protein [Coriobacteriales bacterium]